MAEQITLDQAIAMRDAWLAASMALTTGQEYQIQIGTSIRRLVRGDMKEVRNWLVYWERRVKDLSTNPATRRRARYVVPE